MILPTLKPIRVEGDAMEVEGGEVEHPLEQTETPHGATETALYTDTEISRTEVISAFLRTLLQRGASNLFLGDIASRIHLLINSLERNIVMNILEHVLPGPEAGAL